MARPRRRARRATAASRICSISRARLDTKSFNRRQFESLVKAGAFDCLNPNRAQSFAAADLLLRQASRAAEERDSRQESLFGGIDGRALPRARHCRSSPTGRRSRSCSTSSTRSASTCRATRSTPTARAWSAPASCAGPTCRRRWRRAARPASGSPASSSASKERTSARGNRFAFVQLSDTTGVFEVTVFSEVLAQARAAARRRPAADRHGRCAARGGEPAADRAEDRAARQRRRACRGRAARLCRRGRGAAAPQEPDRPRGRRPRPRHRRARPAAAARSRSRCPAASASIPRIRAAVKSLPGIVDVHDI